MTTTKETTMDPTTAIDTLRSHLHECFFRIQAAYATTMADYEPPSFFVAERAAAAKKYSAELEAARQLYYHAHRLIEPVVGSLADGSVTDDEARAFLAQAEAAGEAWVKGQS